MEKKTLKEILFMAKRKKKLIEPFDYTEWQRNLFEGMSVRELSKKAMQKYTEI